MTIARGTAKVEREKGDRQEERDRMGKTLETEATAQRPPPPNPQRIQEPPTRRGREYTMSTSEMEAKCRELRQLQSLIDEAQTEAETIKDQIKAQMGDQEEVKAGEYKITWKPVTTSRVDTAALKKANPMLVEMYTRTTTTRRFCVA